MSRETHARATDPGSGSPETGWQPVLDRVMPTWDTRIAVSDLVDCSAEQTWAVVRGFDLMRVRSPLITASFALRTLPARLLGRPEPPPPPELKLGEDELGLPGWVGLDAGAGREVAAGAIGVFWTPAIVWHPDVRAATFADFAEPGWGRIAISFAVTPRSTDSSLVVYECRTQTTDEHSRARFRWYWRLIRPMVAHIMRAAVKTIKADAEASFDLR